MKTIVIITEAYPYGGLTEEAFVAPELTALAAEFDRVVVMPVSERGPLAPDLPGNVVVKRNLIDHPLRHRKWLRPLRYPLAMLRGTDDIRYALSAAVVEDALKKIVGEMKLMPADTVMEAFWFDFPAMALSRMRRRGFKYVVRAHGYDVYTGRAPRQRAATIKSSEGVSAVSDAGADYLRKCFPALSSKISTDYLGVEVDVAQAAHTPPGEKRVRLLTVAQVIDRKRCGLCFEFANALAVARPDWQFDWTLIGEGPLLEILREEVNRSKRDNLTVNLTGRLPHEDVMDFYASRPIDWLMLLSTSEGLPIALLEALAHGVPAIATDVGGVAEALTDDSGLLLAPDPEPEEFVRGLMPYLDSRPRYDRLCQGARSIVAEKFDSQTLRRQWAKRLKEMLHR